MSASAGRVLIIPRGAYDAETAYNMLDLVSYQGGSYVCKQPSTGNAPTNTTYWQSMVSIEDLPDMTGATSEEAGTHGLVPAPAAGDQGKVLFGSGTWGNVALPNDMVGATSGANGTHGLVPAPLISDRSKFLKGDGTWGEVDLSTKANESELADAYNSATTYGPLGNSSDYPSFCISGNVLYRNIVSCAGVQPPNATYWVATSVADEISELNSNSTSKVKTVTLSRKAGNYTGSITDQSVKSIQTGNVVQLAGWIKFSVTANTQLYVALSGDIIPPLEDVRGMAIITNDYSMLPGGVRISTGGDLLLYFNSSATYTANDELVFSLVYIV